MNKNSIYFIVLITLNLLLSVTAQSNNQNNNQNTQRKCGENCQWSIEGTTLKITGNGTMTDFYGISAIPWRDHHKTITAVSIEGITTIGKKAFDSFIQLQSIEINRCPCLQSIQFPSTLTNLSIISSPFCLPLNLSDLQLLPFGQQLFYLTHHLMRANNMLKLVQKNI